MSAAKIRFDKWSYYFTGLACIVFVGFWRSYFLNFLLAIMGTIFTFIFMLHQR